MKSILVASLWAVGVAGVAYAQPTITSIVDPYTGSTKLAPGGLAMITGTNLFLGGQVTVGGIAAPELVPPQFGPTMIIQIQGYSATDASFTNGANFVCFAAASAGTFTVPPSILLALPAGTFSGMTFEFDPPYSTFNATGLNVGFVQASYDTPIFATFQ